MNTNEIRASEGGDENAGRPPRRSSSPSFRPTRMPSTDNFRPTNAAQQLSSLQVFGAGLSFSADLPRSFNDQYGGSGGNIDEHAASSPYQTRQQEVQQQAGSQKVPQQKKLKIIHEYAGHTEAYNYSDDKDYTTDDDADFIGDANFSMQVHSFGLQNEQQEAELKSTQQQNRLTIIHEYAGHTETYNYSDDESNVDFITEHEQVYRQIGGDLANITSLPMDIANLAVTPDEANYRNVVDSVNNDNKREFNIDIICDLLKHKRMTDEQKKHLRDTGFDDDRFLTIWKVVEKKLDQVWQELTRTESELPSDGLTIYKQSVLLHLRRVFESINGRNAPSKYTS